MTEEVSEVSIHARRSPMRRLGCTVLLIFWFGLLMIPCVLLLLATNREISIPQGGLPGQEIRIWLIMEADQRGLGVSSTSVISRGENEVCMTTAMNFLLWAGREDPLSYCECFERSGTDQAWIPMEMSADACSAS
ncbi:hypothetical protein QPK87_33800 [Kamptonema cortianum]|nr:hypothetical protein [Kamptonema cortianum]